MSKVYTLIISIASFIVAIDQWSKAWAMDTLKQLGETIPVTSWWSWTLVHNYGAAFGMLRNLPDSIRTVFFLSLPIGVLILLWFTYVKNFKHTEVLGPVAMGLVAGGALGNLVDRAKFGYVVDFIDWHYPSSSESCIPLFYKMSSGACHWPVFNIADSAISTAMVLLIYYAWKSSKDEKQKKH